MWSSRRKEATLAVASAALAMLCFSSVPVFLRHLTGYLDAWTVNAVRYGVSMAFWFPFVVVLDRRIRRDPDTAPRRSVWLAALVPAVPNLLGQIGWAACPYYVNATTIGFVIRVAFLFTALLGFLFIPAERRLARRPLFYIGAAATVTGVFLMYVERLGSGAAASGAEVTGLVIVVATAAAWGGYAVSVRRFLAGYPLRLAFGVICLYTALPLAGLMLVFGRYEALAALPAREWVLLPVSGLIGIAMGHVFYHRGIHGIGPVVASGVTMVGPFVTYALAAVVLTEAITPVQLAGGGVVVGGGLLLLKAKAQADRAEGARILLGTGVPSR